MGIKGKTINGEGINRMGGCILAPGWWGRDWTVSKVSERFFLLTVFGAIKGERRFVWEMRFKAVGSQGKVLFIKGKQSRGISDYHCRELHTVLRRRIRGKSKQHRGFWKRKSELMRFHSFIQQAASV